MAWRGVHLSQKARLSLADGQMVVDQDDGSVRLALEDLAWLVLDTPQASLTANLLSACMEAGMVVVTTDASHLPNGILLPFHGHHRQAGMAERQVAMTAPLKKRLWQGIVKAKIANQAAVLDKLGRDGGKVVAEMARHVGSGDPDNVEARAARQYWQCLFADFRRDDDADRRNKLLNYGYAVVRAIIARALAASGLLPAFGLHHASIGNAFNLADDLIEPFRPFVDLLAHAQGGTKDGELSLQDRRAMVAVLLAEIRLGRDTMTLSAAVEMVAASLVRAVNGADSAELVLPAVPP
ncbi:MAG: type II CRISPR-associated endonuclease Cas1 [Magnetospirillum gryphiswaldense]|nr:type II CRISPR-associated endonuclease Cas1 [Magnetospirillum gryphiswaldense]